MLQGEGHKPTIDIQSPHCTLENLVIQNSGTLHPAVRVQTGTPLIVGCTVTGAGGGISVAAGPVSVYPVPRIVRTTIQGCAGGPGVEFRYEAPPSLPGAAHRKAISRDTMLRSWIPFLPSLTLSHPPQPSAVPTPPPELPAMLRHSLVVCAQGSACRDGLRKIPRC